MELASMPVTPLGRRMQHFGWTDLPTPPALRIAPQPVPVALVTEPPTVRIAPQPIPVALAEAPAENRPVAHVASRPPQIATYASRDASGRVWGMPNAGGRGQCLDCPRKAALPSTRCAECQLRLSSGAPMSDLPEFRARLDRVAAQCPHKEVQSRLETLYEKLQAGQIPEKLQQKLRDFAAQLETKDIRASSVQLQDG
ncbi:unnamed protein product [Durusdinium trenchii]|uniref:Uncharacterized protein n=1 Tax=Durusdinium trenchii TaxID=1381693 RepID=A0ABP0QLH8_9DINO